MILENFNLKGKVAVITGGGGVLCSLMAKELSRHGVKIAILNLDLQSAEHVAETIISSGGEAIAIACNVLDVESVKQAESLVVDAYGGYDILINGAGGNHPEGTTTNETLNLEDLDQPEIKTFFVLVLYILATALHSPILCKLFKVSITFCSSSPYQESVKRAA